MSIEEFVNYYLQNYRHEVLLNPYNGLIEFANAFKEQMLKEAVEGEISSVDVGDDSYVKTLKIPGLQEAMRKFNVGDKVRVIVLKYEHHY